jgi:hypothetical protein
VTTLKTWSNVASWRNLSYLLCPDNLQKALVRSQIVEIEILGAEFIPGGKGDRNDGTAKFCLEGIGAIERDKPALDHERDPVAKLIDVVHIMRCQNDRLSLVAQLPDDSFDIVCISGIEAGRWLIEKQEPRIVLESADEIQAHPHSF